MSGTNKNSGGFFAIYLIIFLAGFMFLLYEVSWNRLLSLALGTTVTASTIVLASFMAGFGTGAYYWGKIANKREKTGYILAILFTGIGIFSLLNYLYITRVIPCLYVSFSGLELSPGITDLTVFALSAIVLLISAFMIGGVFPVICRIVIQSDDTVASSLGRLYALDTLGCTIGGLATGFLLLGTLGQMNTIIFAVVINITLAIWLFLSGKYNQNKIIPDSELSDNEHQKKIAAVPPNFRNIALVGTFICGFCILSLQVFWIRIFQIYLTNTSYTFALVASLAILGLFTGSTLFKRRANKIKDHEKSMRHVIMLIGVSAILGLLLLIYMPEILMFPFMAVMGSPIIRVFVLPIVASVLVVFPPAIFSGYAFPLACRMYSAGSKTISRDVGVVLMVNTIGSVIGPLTATFILLPLIGVVLSVVLLIALSAITALYIDKRRKAFRSSKLTQSVLYAVVAILLILIVYKPVIRILPPSFGRFDRDILFYRESVEGTVTVGRDVGTRTESKYTYVNNSSVIGSTYDAIKIVKMIGHFPFLMGADCKNVLVIGFGIGVTTSAIASHPEVESIECVELVDGLKEAAVFYKELNRNVAEDPRLKFISGDGRHYLQMSGKKYDLISCDPTHPILGSGNLYVQEYFRLCREHLNPGGMVSQFMPLHKLGIDEFLGILKTFHAEFPHCTVWLGHTYGMLLGSMEPIRIDFEKWAAEVGELEPDDYFYIDPYHLAATLTLDGDAIDRFTAESKINSDDLSYTEFFAPSCLYDDNTRKNLEFMMKNKIDIDSVFFNIVDPEMMGKYVLGNQLLSASLQYRLKGETQSGLRALQQACRVNPENQEYPFLIKLYY